MGLWMRKQTALARLVEDEAAPIMARVRALEQIEHPALAMLRRLIVESRTPRNKPTPAKLRATAALRYAREWEARQKRKRQKSTLTSNLLGISIEG